MYPYSFLLKDKNLIRGNLKILKINFQFSSFIKNQFFEKSHFSKILTLQFSKIQISENSKSNIRFPKIC